MTFSKFVRKGTGVTFKTEEVATVLFRRIPDAKLAERALELVRHYIGDTTIDLATLDLAMRFCGPKIAESMQGGFLIKERNVFTMLYLQLNRTDDRKLRKILIDDFRSSIGRKTVLIHGQRGTIQKEWEAFKLKHSPND